MLDAADEIFPMPGPLPNEAETALAEAYLALLNLGAATHGFLEQNAQRLDGRTRMFLARLRDLAADAAERAGARLHDP